MALQQWFEGIHLIGQFNWFQTGCWLLVHGDECAILELPPAGLRETGPARVAEEALKGLPDVRVKFLLCTHCHPDHFSKRTLRCLQTSYPDARAHLQSGFRKSLGQRRNVSYFDDIQRLDLAGEPLFLVHAPKHSPTDTMVIFRGVACTGDWELGTIHSVHDWTRIWSVPTARKLESIARMERFDREHNYRVHATYSVHANDKRTGVDFARLMASTRNDPLKAP